MPHRRFFLGKLVAAGVLLALAGAANAQVPVITDQPANLTVCAGSPAVFSVAASGDSLIYEWQVSVDKGTNFANISETETNASYTNLVTTVADNGNKYQVIVSGLSGSLTSTPPAVLTVIAPATADASTNQTTCGTSCISLHGSVGGCATGGLWTTTGTGTFNPNSTTLNASYCPSAGDVGQKVTLTLTSRGQCSPCGDATAQVVVTINSPATASAGPNRTICAGNDTGGLGGSVGGAATGGQWSSSGSGTFSPNATTLDATYAPSLADQTAGSVTLTLTATGQLPPCVASAHVVVTINAAPAITGEPASRTNCPGAPASFSVTATGVGLTYQWQVSADNGTTFTNVSNTATNASYTNPSPTLADDNGLQYRVIVSGACTPPQTSTPPATLTIYTPATASAGGNQTICVGHWTAGLGGSVGGGALGGRWSSPTAGIFLPNATTLNATYLPSLADQTAGSVTLTLTAQPCGDAAAQVVVTINPTPAAPTTSGASICSGSVANLSATGSGGTLNWYSDSGLTTWLASGTTYGPSPTTTTTYYVAETSTLGCEGPARPVTATVLNGTDTVYAGPHQNLALSVTNAIRMAGSVANGATSATWSGGSGTFNPNAQTMNALYSPSAAEVAAGSWALTLTANTVCGPVSNTMSFSIAPPPLTLPLIRSKSSAGMNNLCLDPTILGLHLGKKCDSSVNNLTGYVVVQLDTNGQPAEIAVQDYKVAATGDYNLHYSWLFGLYLLDVTASDVALAHGDPGGPQNSLYPVYNTNDFTILSLPTDTSGEAGFTIRANINGTEYGTNGSFPLNMNVAVPAMGSIIVTNGVVWMGMSFTASNTFSTPSISNTFIALSYDLDGDLVASGPLPVYPPRALVWNNGAGTGNWNTNDANWNRGTAIWRDGELDGAIFTDTGVGTVTLTQPITPAWLWFRYPGYTIAGSSLALPAGSAITNDANATIASAIIAGAVNEWGPGMLTLSGTNTYSGGTWVNGGTLQITGDGQLGALSGSPAINLTLNGGQLFNNNSSLSLTANRTVSLGAGGGYLEADGSGNTLTVNGQITGAGAGGGLG